MSTGALPCVYLVVRRVRELSIIRREKKPASLREVAVVPAQRSGPRALGPQGFESWARENLVI